MAVAAIKHVASNFAKLDKFERVDFRRWQKKMHFLLSSKSVVYVLTTHILEDGGDDATMEQIRKRAKWENDDYVCRGLILKDGCDDATMEQIRKRAKWENDDYVCRGLILKGSLIKRFRTDKGGEYMDTMYIIHETTSPYTSQQMDDLKTFDEAMKSQDVAFWKEAISIMGNNTWVLADLPPGCKPFGCEWIFKRKLKVDATIEKFKARLVIQGFKQKLGIYYFDTYAPVARIIAIRLLIVMASIHNLIIHQMDVKTAFLNGELEEEHASKKWHQKFDEVVLSNGYLLNQADKCVYSKFDESSKGVIICLFVDDMLIFDTDQVHVDLTKEFLSSRFSMKDTGEADVTLVSTLIDTSKKLMPNNGQDVSQLEYSRVIGCLMYAMTCTRPDIAFAMGKLSRDTLMQVGSATLKTIRLQLSGWVFLLGGGAISWAFKKQTCITGSTMESEFVALAGAAPIFIRCDSAATLAKAYSQMYNWKSRHLGVRHSMIRELITNGEVSIEFVRSQQNLADHLTKGLARDMVLKSAEWMSLKSNQGHMAYIVSGDFKCLKTYVYFIFRKMPKTRQGIAFAKIEQLVAQRLMQLQLTRLTKTVEHSRNIVIVPKVESTQHEQVCNHLVKYATCTLIDGALTWWNSYVQSVRIDTAYELTWKELMKVMTQEQYPINEIQKMKTVKYDCCGDNLKSKINSDSSMKGHVSETLFPPYTHISPRMSYNLVL
nr:zinc finger, CCHC-type [Tanacetum cinerariifolium]